MGFRHELEEWPAERVRRLIDKSTASDVDRALSQPDRTLHDLAALLSPHTPPRLETVAREAQRLTRWHFGRTIGLYVPIYLSNVCVADCVYCGFSVKNKQKRVTLKPEKIRQECEMLAAEGFQSILLVTGEAHRIVNLDYLSGGVAIAREYFPSVSIEVHSMEYDDYKHLSGIGLEGVTLYMETYHRETYSRVHLEGGKADYDYRLGAIERAGRAGVRRLSVGALLGLYDWRIEAFWAGLHARYLQKQCWQSAVAVSFPRLRHVPERFAINHPVADADLVQMMLALRLFLPEAGFNLSTREAPEFRDRLIPLGVTMMSAGSSTRPGGYATYVDESLEQFEIDDDRNPEEVVKAIQSAGYDPVWKDFDHAFDRDVVES